MPSKVAPLRPFHRLVHEPSDWRETYEAAYQREELRRYPAEAAFVVRRASGGHALGTLHPSDRRVYSASLATANCRELSGAVRVFRG